MDKKMQTDNDEIPTEAYLAIIIWVLWMLFSTFTVYFVESSLLFVFFIGGSCLISYSMYRLFKKIKREGEE